jgi:DNA-binding XRE family transcriptional regulator
MAFSDYLSSKRFMVNKAFMHKIWPTPRLIRAARGLAGVDQATLAEQAGVSRKAVIAIEGDESDSMDYRRLAVLEKLRIVLESEFEIEFLAESRIGGEGVRVKKTRTTK